MNGWRYWLALSALYLVLWLILGWIGDAPGFGGVVVICLFASARGELEVARYKSRLLNRLRGGVS